MVLGNVDLGRVYRPHCVWSVLTHSVKILPYRPPVWLVRANAKVSYYYSVSIKRISDIKSKTRVFFNGKTKANIFAPTKSLNCILALISLNYGNLIVICLNLREICKSNRGEIFTALNHYLVPP